MIVTQHVHCPYCGERFETVVDVSGGDQSYIEDCYVCCRPIVFQLTVSANGNLGQLTAKREDD
ncbi:MAG: CPXCG motif-containing cysteine-rich protein [Gammaproteobacteria bacterium]|nr:CPXCG motif-containing cysteine-rich protein [Gammaproteobacteria bacterium]